MESFMAFWKRLARFIGRGGNGGDGAQTAATASSPASTRLRGQAAEERALAHLQRAGLRLAERNYRTPGRGGGEIDLIMHDADGTLVFVEVRARANARHGGAAASVTARKRHRIVRAARHYLLRYPVAPPCRFDVIAIEGGDLRWLRAAFDTEV
jgi:putative endonuclease